MIRLSFFLVGVFMLLGPEASLAQEARGARDVRVPEGVYKPFFRDKDEADVKVGPLRVDRTPVTNEQFLEFLKTNPKWRRSRVQAIFADESYLKHWAGDLRVDPKWAQHPVTFVSWFAARDFCAAQGGRLPTLAEWEYFSDTASSAYEEETLKWYARSGEDVRSVAQGKPNKFGLYDTRAHIWEWVEDFSSVFVAGGSRGPTGDALYCGGGSMGVKDPKQYAAFMRFAFRSSLKARYTSSRLGFRCVREP